MVSTHPPTSKSSSPINNPLVIVPNAHLYSVSVRLVSVNVNCQSRKECTLIWYRDFMYHVQAHTHTRANVLTQSTTHTHGKSTSYLYISSSSSSSSCHAGSTDIPDPLSPLLPIVHRLRQVFRTTSRILTQLLNVCSCWSSCFCTAICGGP